MKKILLLVSFLLPAFAPPCHLISFAQTSPGPSTTTLGLPGLKERVTVHRDERGVPFIEAANEADLYFAQGYITASDRLWQMDLLRRTARGELSEIVGRLALEEDKRRRLYNFSGVAEAQVARVSAPVRAAFEAYARGVNAYLASLDEKTLPPEFRLLRYRPRPWRPSDSHVIGKNFAEVLSTTWTGDLALAALSDLSPELLRRMFPDSSPLDVLVVGNDRRGPAPRRRPSGPRPQVTIAPTAPVEILRELARLTEIVRTSHARLGLHAEELAASNNWVVSGRRSATGQPLLANDPHLSPAAPSIWYLTHLAAPGLRVAGVTAPGAPGIIIGHNERIAWGMTNLGPDVQDLYHEKFDPANPRRYQTPTGWREAEVRREEIKVRQGLVDPATETVTVDVTVTRHGPIIFEKEGRRYALRWTALDPQSPEFEASYMINRARNWDEFRTALRLYPGPTQNFVYADVDGNIGYYGAGYIPLRKTGDGSLPYDGATDDGEWTGFIPFAELPHSYNPPAGLIVTANSRVAGRSYRHFLTRRWSSPYRSRRIYELLQAKPKLTIEDFLAIQADTFSISGATFARETLRVARETGADDTSGGEKWRETLRLLEDWDGRLTADSRAALLVAHMREAFRVRVTAAQLGAERARELKLKAGDTFIDEVITARSPAWLPKEYPNYLELLRACEREARETLTKQLGPDETKWMWGAENTGRFPHPLARAPLVGQQFLIPPFPLGGSGGGLATVNVGAFVSMRLVADPSDWDRTRQGIAPGQSGLPGSPHWKDQVEEWRAAQPRPLAFSPAAVRRSARTTLVLNPVRENPR